MPDAILNPSVNSNNTVFQITEEQTLRNPFAAGNASLRWYYMALNSFKDFGAKISTVARSTINNTRQQLKGTVTGITATGGFNDDFCQFNLQRLMQGFFYNDANVRPLASSQPDLPYIVANNYLSAPLASATGTLQGTFAGVSTNYFPAGTLLGFTDWQNEVNNGLHVVTTSTTSGGDTAVTPALTQEASNAQQKVRVVGFQFPAGDLQMTVAGNTVRLTSSSSAWGSVAPAQDEWLFIGGDGASSYFAANENEPFYGRVSYVDPAHGYVTLDMTTGVQAADNGAGKSVQVFCGTRMLNGSKRRTYTMSRIYPNYIETVNGQNQTYPNAEHIVGAIPDTLTLNIKQQGKLDVDMSFTAMDSLQDGKGVSSGVPYTAGTFVNEADEDAYNTSVNIFMMRLSILDALTLNPTPYFAYATDVTFDIKNNVSPNNAIGVVGAFDATVGNFEPSAKISAYFASVHAIAAMRNNASIGLQIIGAKENAGFILDTPLMTMSGGMPTVDKDKPIMMDITAMGAKNANGYTTAMTYFDYLPNAAMAS